MGCGELKLLELSVIVRTRALTWNVWHKMRFIALSVVMYEKSFLSVGSMATKVTSAIGASFTISCNNHIHQLSVNYVLDLYALQSCSR